MSTEDSCVLSSQDSCCPDHSPLQLHLTLGVASVSKTPLSQDFHSSFAASSSSSSSPSLSRTNATPPTNRCADSAAPPISGSHVVGWPPIRTHRMNSFSNQAKSRAYDKINNTVIDKTINGNDKKDCIVQEKMCPRNSTFVKVNMDGTPIGRKVDLDAHGCYGTLAETLEDMFLRPATNFSTIQGYCMMVGTTGHSKLLDGSSGFALTYEDKDGDWMLAGDVPWGMFIGSVRRLRIIRSCEANGIGTL